MKLGFIGWNDLPRLQEDARFAAEHGFEGIEFNYWAGFKDLTADTVVQMRKILDDHGVRAASLGIWGYNHLSLDPEERQACLGHMSRAIEFAEMLGASVFVTGGGEIPNVSLDAKVAEFARVFPPFIEQAEKAGLKVALYAVHGNSFLDGIEAYKRVWEQVPQVGIKLDPANLVHHGGYLHILRDYGNRVFHVHIKEHIYMDDKVVSQPAAGMGDIAWGKVMAFLYEHNYDGYLSLEPHGPLWSREPLRRKMLLLSQRYLKQFLL